MTRTSRRATKAAEVSSLGTLAMEGLAAAIMGSAWAATICEQLTLLPPLRCGIAEVAVRWPCGANIVGEPFEKGFAELHGPDWPAMPLPRAV
jgi:hypothetical protein